jgi:hypothetical protein
MFHDINSRKNITFCKIDCYKTGREKLDTYRWRKFLKLLFGFGCEEGGV